MVNYTPAPQDLSKLNPIQRYMQKGSLDYSDWLRLGAIILAYWFLRPYFQKFAKKLSKDSQEGEEETEAYKQRRAAAVVGANNIRSGKKELESKTLGQVLDAGVDGFATSSGATTGSSNIEGQDTEVKNRKQKKSKGVSFAPQKSEVDKMLDWEDENEFDPRRKPVGSDGGEEVATGDIKQWMEKWTE